MAILNFPPVKWDFQESVQLETKSTMLGDGYSLAGNIPFSDRTNYSLVFAGLNQANFSSVLQTFQSYAGWQTFQFRPIDSLPYRTYVAANISISNNGINTWTITVTLQEIR